MPLILKLLIICVAKWGENMSNNVITIAGYSCSGKSTVIKQLEEIYNCQILRFGMIHRECVKENGYNYAKDWIKEKGFEVYEMELLKKYIQELKASSSSDKLTIVDGIFSYKCFSLMKECKNINLVNIVLSTDYDTRLERMMKREHLNVNEAKNHLATTDCIKERAGLSKIIGEPTCIIDGSKNIEEIKNECLYELSKISMDRTLENKHISEDIKNINHKKDIYTLER